MKKLLTLIIPEMTAGDGEQPEVVEILSVDSDKTLYEAIKQAKGKYCVVSGGDIVCDIPEDFFEVLDRASADILVFDGSYCIKTAVLKGVSAKNCKNKFCADVYACLSAKTVTALDIAPFALHPTDYRTDEAETQNLCEVLDEFKRKKEKLGKEVYAFAFDLLCERLCAHYADALIAGKKDNGELERLKAFDAQLKENIVLYLALEKRFKPANLQKLRKNGFKLGLLEYSKLKKSRK